MTNEEAIKFLQQLYPLGGHCWLDEQRMEAIGMAIEALSQSAMTKETRERWNERLDEEQKCIYNRTLEERQRACRFCSAACQVRVMQHVNQRKAIEK